MVRALDGLAPALALLGGPEAILAVGDASGVVARWWP
jgi:hypothetical protein